MDNNNQTLLGFPVKVGNFFPEIKEGDISFGTQRQSVPLKLSQQSDGTVVAKIAAEAGEVNQ